jgi:hypothetical protein
MTAPAVSAPSAPQARQAGQRPEADRFVTGIPCRGNPSPAPVILGQLLIIAAPAPGDFYDLVGLPCFRTH